MNYYYYYYYYYLLTYLLTYFLTAIEVPPGASSPYSNTNKTNKNEIYINETLHNTVNTSTHIIKTPTHYKTQYNTVNTSTHITKTPTHYKTQYNNTQRSKYKYTYYQNTHTLQNTVQQYSSQ